MESEKIPCAHQFKNRAICCTGLRHQSSRSVLAIEGSPAKPLNCYTEKERGHGDVILRESLRCDQTEEAPESSDRGTRDDSS